LVGGGGVGVKKGCLILWGGVGGLSE